MTLIVAMKKIHTPILRSQIKFNLSPSLKEKLVQLAAEAGLTPTGYLKYLIIKESSELIRIKSILIEKGSKEKIVPDQVDEFYTEEL